MPLSRLPIAQIGQQATSAILKSFTSAPSAAGGAGLSGAAAGGIAAGVGVFLALGMSLLAAHDQRFKNAKSENEGAGVALPVFDADIRTIIEAANNGTVSADEALQYFQETSNSFWQYMSQWKGPGISSIDCGPWAYTPATGLRDCYHGGINCNGNKVCTVGCCLGCNVVDPALTDAAQAIRNGGGSFRVCKVYGNKYGLQTREGYTLTYVKPNIVQGTEGALQAFWNSVTGSGSTLAANLPAQKPTAQIKKVAIFGGAALVLLFFARKVL